MATTLAATAGRNTRWRHLPAVLLAVVAFGAALLIQAHVAPSGTGDADESIYVAQADLLRSGQVTMSTATHVPSFRPWLTGEEDGRLFFQYEPAWPAVLAVSQIVTGGTAVGPALCFAALVLVAYGLALELFRSRASALGAAVCTLLTPLLLFHSALTLAYLFTSVLCLAALWLASRVARGADRWPSAVGLGAVIGTVLLTRPVDGMLAVLGCALMLVVFGHDRWREVPRLAALGLLGLAPFLLVAAWFNLRTTGSLTSFPLSASDPLNRFGFGERRMQVGTDAMNYDVHTAETALWDNLRGGISWLFGGVLALGLVAVALVRRSGLAERLVLLAFAALFPVTYFFWWATALAAPGATNGVGPHYYVPAVAALAVLEGDGLARLARWAQRTWSARRAGADAAADRSGSRLVLGSVAVALLVLATLPSLPDKLDLQRYVNGLYTDVQAAVPDDLGPALVILQNEPPQTFLLIPYPFQRNRPDLDGDVLWALDRGGANAPLIQAHPDRTPYSLRTQRGVEDPVLQPRWHLTELSVREGSPLALSVIVRPPTDMPQGAVEMTVGDLGAPVRPAPPPGGTGETPLKLTGCGTAASTDLGAWQIDVSEGSSRLVVALQSTGGDRWEQRIDVWCDAATSTISAVLPGTGWHRVDFGNGPVWLAEDVTPVVEVR